MSAFSSPPGLNLRVYHLGNSLTRNIPLERLQALFESAGGGYDYGLQLGGGHRLELHLVKRNHGNKPGEGKFNSNDKYGNYDHAFRNLRFDAVVLQPFAKPLAGEPAVLNAFPWFTCGDLAASSAFIDYARGRTSEGLILPGLTPPNPGNVACERFYVYATWPPLPVILEQEGEDKSYAAFYAQPYDDPNAVNICADFFRQLVEGLNARHPDLPVPVRLIPAGEVFAHLDRKIRARDVPGIDAFFARNHSYYADSRKSSKSQGVYDPEFFDPDFGIFNVYADNIHLNDQPHNGPTEGAIGSYIAALTVFATLSGRSPVGLTAEPYEQFDPVADAALIRALQEAVWETVAGHPLTGVPAPGK